MELPDLSILLDDDAVAEARTSAEAVVQFLKNEDGKNGEIYRCVRDYLAAQALGDRAVEK